ncbi:MAG: hypothetical protein U1D31_00245 [Patescibacteria group bacterium]|nr:hypothetical protein [bacterium]MDZ4240550.1 hypothetical protein [Patescibacteria group bacterium]
MARNIVQDVLPPDRRSIRDIPLPNRRKEERKAEPPKQSSSPSSPEKNEKKTHVAIWVIAALSVIVLLFAVASLFVGATVKVTPQTQEVLFNNAIILSASRDALNTNAAAFEIMTLNKEKGKEVPATKEVDARVKASGTIVIYNNHSAESQRLVKNTRFETPEGLVYRVAESVVVPGKTTKDGKTTPGSAESVVYADEPGEKYNIGLADFTIPGFKGSPQYSNFYARSKTPMTGGFVGKIKEVEQGTLAETKQEIQGALMSELLTEAKDQIPENFILYDGGVFYSFEDLPQGAGSATSAEIRQKGTLYGVMFKRGDFINYLAQSMVPEFGSEADFLGLDDLVLSIKEKNNTNPERMTEFKFTFEGNGVFVALFEAEKLKVDLSGRERSVAKEIFGTYSSIAEATVTVMPFWRSMLPEDPNKIKVEIVLPGRR